MSNHADLAQAANACTPDGRYHKLAPFTPLLALLHTLLPAKEQVVASMA
jgi:hypothetical protein